MSLPSVPMSYSVLNCVPCTDRALGSRRPGESSTTGRVQTRHAGELHTRNSRPVCYLLLQHRSAASSYGWPHQDCCRHPSFPSLSSSRVPPDAPAPPTRLRLASLSCPRSASVAVSAQRGTLLEHLSDGGWANLRCRLHTRTTCSAAFRVQETHDLGPVVVATAIGLMI